MCVLPNSALQEHSKFELSLSGFSEQLSGLSRGYSHFKVNKIFKFFWRHEYMYYVYIFKLYMKWKLYNYIYHRDRSFYPSIRLLLNPI